MIAKEAKLKNDMVRIARKEARLLIAPLLERIAAQKKELIELKRGRTFSSSPARQGARKPRRPSQVSLQEARDWFSAHALVELRTRLDLSAAQLGRLAGSSVGSIYLWESGKTPSDNFVVKLASLRKLGKRRARQLLEATAAQ
ncbi:helix-turn-helix transcriptional regulator [Lysobacter firmicutimachus]|uniref:Helix-turn-helix transcriptional regulator n=1 Tax=Lysobacter firmicutimachus TaxID=1792846 RepID=A0AAU8MTR4_9GAMM|nr:helix-turn-helix transcriptional regulator [Lysobacter antibioticus]